MNNLRRQSSIVRKDDEDDDEENKMVGLDDFVLMEDFTNENEFINNLKIRHEANIIYVISFQLNRLKKTTISIDIFIIPLEMIENDEYYFL